MGVTLHQVNFVRGALEAKDFPEILIPEIAFFGRSNVGKSTFLNRLCNRKQLAKTSAKPGKTSELNFFEVTLSDNGEQKSLSLVDLPGFGYAQFSKKKREYLSKLTVEYILNREQLAVVCLLNDARRDKPQQDELAIRELAERGSRAFLLVVTKLDKLKRNERATQIKKLKEAYDCEPEQIYRSGEESIEKIWSIILSKTTPHP